MLLETSLNMSAPRSALERALSIDSETVRRLSFAKTSVRFTFFDGSAVTVLMDREPPEVAPVDHARAEIEIQLGAASRDFLSGQLNMSLAALADEVECRGPVRKYLVVDAVLRRLLRDAGR